MYYRAWVVTKSGELYMLIGVPKEIKNQEYRVGLTPSSVRELVSHGHKVMVQHNAGIGIGVSDSDYEKAGATISHSAEEIFAKAEMIVKVRSRSRTNVKCCTKGRFYLLIYI